MKLKVKDTSYSSLFGRLIIACFTLLLSCTTTATHISAAWKEPSATGYNNFFVAVLTKNIPARSLMESNITSRLKKQGVAVTPSLEVFPSSQKVETPEERTAAVEKIQSLGYDAIITIALVKQTEEKRYIAGKTQYAPMNIGYGTGYGTAGYTPAVGGVMVGTGYYGNFAGYYNYGVQNYSTESYYETDKIYFVESNVYDAKTSKLVWSAQSETFNPGNIKNASEDFSYVMVDALKKANLVLKKKK